MNGAGDGSERVRAWAALSDLYLDAPYRPHVRAAARTLAATRYTADELRTMLFEDVHPVVCANLCASAGVWDAFEPCWLAARVAANRRRPALLRARGRCARGYAELMWRLLAPRIAGARDAARTRVSAAASFSTQPERP